MKFLLDQGLPRSTVRHLQDMGIAAEHIGDLRLSAASDARILSTARDREASIVTLDSDFHALLATSGASSPSVIRIRRTNRKDAKLAQLMAGPYIHGTAVLFGQEPLPKSFRSNLGWAWTINGGNC
jgi:predicted nuclease of predicted toxin-antitoxin system